jgi:hypothetical protein
MLMVHVMEPIRGGLSFGPVTGLQNKEGTIVGQRLTSI